MRVPYLLFDEAGANLGCHHVNDGGDVILEPVGEATPARNGLLVHLSDVLCHALHLNINIIINYIYSIVLYIYSILLSHKVIKDLPAAQRRTRRICRHSHGTLLC